MTLDDFEPRRRDDGSSDRYWRAKAPLITPSGEFRLEMVTSGKESDPDAALIAELERFVEFARPVGVRELPDVLPAVGRGVRPRLPVPGRPARTHRILTPGC